MLAYEQEFNKVVQSFNIFQLREEAGWDLLKGVSGSITTWRHTKALCHSSPSGSPFSSTTSITMPPGRKRTLMCSIFVVLCQAACNQLSKHVK
jgi:hypothetical protein